MNLLNHNNVWRADYLPDGLSLNDGVISGKPSARGVYDVQVTVSNELGSSTQNIRINCKYSDDMTILKDGELLELIRPAELQSSILDGSAQTKYNCTTTQLLIPLTHPLTGEVLNDVPLNFCAFRNATLQDGSTKAGLILQFANTLWKGFAPFGTNSFNRWKYSQLRKWLNSAGDNWFTSDYSADTLTPHEGSYTEDGVKGFLSCLPDALREIIVPVKVTTQALFDDYNEDSAIDDPDDIDGYDADITYDKIFIPSLSEMGIFSDDEYISKGNFEGSTWEYYSALTDGTAICKDINGNTCSVISRSAYLDGTTKVLYVDPQLQASAGNVYNADSAPAPAFFICGGDSTNV